MGIQMTCPNGHELKVKSKYAGKRCLCPLCEDRVVITVPVPESEDDALYASFCNTVFGEGHDSSLSGDMEPVLSDADEVDASYNAFCEKVFGSKPGPGLAAC